MYTLNFIMSIIIFLFLSLVSIILGFYSFFSFHNSVFLFLLFSGVVPTANVFSKFISIKGIYFFDFYFIFIIINYIISLLKSEIKLNKQFILIIFCISFSMIYLIAKLFTNFKLDVYTLKDIRPFIAIIYGSCFYAIIYKNKETIKGKSIFFLLNIIFLSKIFTYFVLQIFPISQSEYILRENYRYADFSVYVSMSFILIYFNNKEIFDVSKIVVKLTFLMSLIVVILSTNRTIFFGLIFSIFIFSKLRVFSKIITLVFFSLAFYSIVNIFNIERIKSALTYSGLIIQLTERYYPALEHISTMNYVQMIFGKGIGTNFEIPWFAYRVGDDLSGVYLNNIDSTYATLYVKHGILSVIIIAIYLQSLTRKYDFRTKMSFIVLILIMFTTIAIPYQTSFSTYFIVFSNILAIYLESLKNNVKKTIK